MAGRDRFAGGDQRYLRDVQYRDRSRLSARASLHAKYGTAPTAWFPWLAAQVSWPVNGRVLEVGCGPGWLWVEAGAHLPTGLDVTLTDLSHGMVADARRQVARGVVEHTTGAVADAQDLPFGDGRFDAVVANHVLYHVPDPARAVGELARVLKPGGTLVAATNGLDHMRELGELQHDVFGIDPRRAIDEAFGAEVAGRILRRWFSTVEWRPYVDALVVTEPVDALAFMCSMPPAEDATDPERQRLESLLADRFARGGGVLRITKQMGLFLCQGPRGSDPLGPPASS